MARNEFAQSLQTYWDTIMKFFLTKNSLALICLLSISGCDLFPSVDHTGLLPVDIEGQVHTVDCRVLVDYENAIGAPTTEEFTEMPQVCSNGAPEAALLARSCEVVTTDEATLDNYKMLRGESARVSFFEAVSSALDETAETCFLPPATEPGDGEVLSRTDMLVTGTAEGLRDDEIGKILPKTSLTNSLAVLVDSKVHVGAKFLKWRHADTTAAGSVEFDRSNCHADDGCDLMVRQISLKLEDFTIVRPTVFARDVTVKDARIYSISSHAARVGNDGRFTLEGVNAIISSVIDGKKVNLLSTQDLRISGQFNDELHAQNHAALTLSLNIDHANEKFSIQAKASFQIRKFPTKLATGTRTPVCLTGGTLTRYREARVTECDLKRPFQTWYFEQKGRYLRVRQPLINMCLNVKSESQNYDGGIVSIVNCSDHWDQLWAIDHDFNVVNLHTRKCLDLGRNKNRGEDDLVTIHSCNAKANGQDWSVRSPG